MYEGHRSTKTVQRSLIFLATIFNQSDERKNQQNEPKFEEKRLILQQGNTMKSNQRSKS
jgi:hypothetical protein